MNMQKPPPFVLTEAVHTTAIAPPNIPIIRGTSPVLPHSGTFGIPHNVVASSREFTAAKLKIEQDFQSQNQQLVQSIEQELAATRLEGNTHPLPPAQAITRELGVRHTLIARKTAQLHQKNILVNHFFGETPLNKDFHVFYRQAQNMDSNVRPRGLAMQAWATSYRAAHEAMLLTQSIAILNQQQVGVQKWLAAVQANDQERIAAEQQAQRAAAELARINEQARLAALAETARRQKEQQEIQAREQARVAALLEAQRLADELAQIAAAAAARQVAAEQARLQAQAEVQRREEERRQLAEKTRREKQQKALRKAQKKQRKKARKIAREQAQRQAENAKTGQPPLFANAGSMAALGPTFTGPLGVFGNNLATTLALRTSLQTAVSLALAAISTAAAPVIVGFAALLAPSKLGNSDLYSASVPLSDLAPDLNEDLHHVAAVGGTVDLPVRLGSSTIGDKVEFVVVTTDGVTVPAPVPVRAARFDASKNVYVSTASDTNGPTLTWTPLVQPQDTSTHLPLADNDPPVYDGAEVVPDEGRIDPFPELDRYGFGGFITVFPTESGLSPLYVVFSSPYEGGVEGGEHSGRAFNPEETGGPILDLEWSPVTATSEGASTVRLHISRFPESAANKVMIDRLEKIISGELEITDTDKRFYTHELRELERFRALGYGDNERPDPNSPVWNNVHTATLEDFKLKDDASLLYTPEALAADAEQVELEYQRLLKEMWK
ncbi:S-type pyocin domain-containing protein [Pseudomonas sp. B707]|uniref:S-type pyocin domain-containing protein n=1 Tax=Pseudomonas sp. B707 TaxID=2689570 RepID=UPI001F0D25BE|nr:S-type pyocin domain-containing protein [Pseudomonas sp. B707]